MKNAETFTEIYNRYAGLVMKSVVAQTNDVELGNEICQKVFLSFYRNMDRVEEDYVKTWLLHAARNQLIDHWRKASTRKELPMADDSPDITERLSSVDLEKQCSDRMFICELMEDLKREKWEWFQVVECICIWEMSPEETAGRLGISAGLVRSRLYRARRYLQKKYGNGLQNL